MKKFISGNFAYQCKPNEMLSTRNHPKMPDMLPNIPRTVSMGIMIKKMISRGRNSVNVRLGGPYPMTRSIGINVTKSTREAIKLSTKSSRSF